MEQNVLLVNRNFPGINPLLAGEEHCTPGHFYGPAVREYYLIHYVVSGQGVLQLEDQEYRLSGGDMFLLKPGQRSIYTADTENPWHYIWVGFSSEFDLESVFQYPVISSKSIGSIFLSVMEAANLKVEAEYFVCGKIYEIICRLKNELLSGEMERTSRYVLMAKNFIETNYAKDISIRMIADALNLDRCYFSTIFKKHTGKSPQTYLVDYRLEKAAYFMTVYRYTPLEAADCCGYPDIFNFSRMFKRKYGVSPRQYQNQYI